MDVQLSRNSKVQTAQPRVDRLFKRVVHQLEATPATTKPTVSEATKASASVFALHLTRRSRTRRHLLHLRRAHVTSALQVSRRRIWRPSAAKATAIKRAAEATMRASRTATAACSSLRLQAKLQASLVFTRSQQTALNLYLFHSLFCFVSLGHPRSLKHIIFSTSHNIFTISCH